MGPMLTPWTLLSGYEWQVWWGQCISQCFQLIAPVRIANDNQGLSWHIDITQTSTTHIHGANMGPTWALLAPYGPHIGPMNLAIRVWMTSLIRSAHLSMFPSESSCKIYKWLSPSYNALLYNSRFYLKSHKALFSLKYCAPQLIYFWGDKDNHIYITLQFIVSYFTEINSYGFLALKPLPRTWLFSICY